MTSEASYQASPSTFFDYRRTEINTVTDLQRLQSIAGKIGLDDALIQLIQDALDRNKEHKFSIAVVGEFKRGKSTFINALLGKDVLPSDIEPCSATLNRVNYGLKPSVQVVFRDENGADGRIEHVDIDQLSAYVTKLTPESEQIAASIKEAIVYYPLPYLQNNVEIIDTPGLNDDAAMTEVTLSVLPQVSAAILVIMPESPFSGYEADFLNHDLLLQDLGRVIFVVTALDRVRKQQDRERIVKVIENRITIAVERRLLEQFGSEESDEYKLYRKQIGIPQVFGLSGYLALEARETNNPDMLTQSDFPKFEAALEKFVTQTRGAVELQVLANRIVSTCNEVLKKLAIEVGALQMTQQEFEQTYTASMGDLEALRQRRLEEMRKIDEAAEKTKKRLQPLAEEVSTGMQRAAEQLIDDTEVRPEDINNAAFIQEMNDKVAAAVRIAAKQATEKIQIELERDLANELNRLGDYAAQVNQVLHNIELQFTHPDNAKQSNEMAKSGLAIGVSALAGTLFGGALAGYHEAGARGAAVGAAAGIGTAFAGVALLTALSLPIAWPALLAMGVVSAFGGKWAARMAFKQHRAERFKQSYKEEVLEQLEQQIKTQHPDAAINQYIGDTYKSLKDKLMGELDASIEQTRNTLDQLRGQKARQETLAEQRRKDVEEYIREIQDIRSRAQGLSQQLIQVTSI